MGDDLPDLAAIRACALGMVPADGDRFVASHADWRSRKPGGRGAVREACEFILDARGALDSARAPFLLALLLALLLAPCVHVPGARALDSDAKQPIHIVADEAVSDERAGLTLYRGNVTMSQGSTPHRGGPGRHPPRRRRDRQDCRHRLPRPHAPAPEPDSPVMNAWGDTIEYYHKEDRMLLLDNAQLEQDGSILKGDRIDYFINDRLVKAASEQDAGQRVRVVIPPTSWRSRRGVTVLRASHLAKSYRGRPVVQDVSLEIASGQIVGLLGPNGAGKTTCFYMIVGIIAADRAASPWTTRTSPPCPCTGGRGGASATCPRKPPYSGASRWRTT